MIMILVFIKEWLLLLCGDKVAAVGLLLLSEMLLLI